jgi:DNA-binding MarR family transcriptional regulator
MFYGDFCGWRFKVLRMNESSNWTFFTNHAHVMVCLARNGDRPLREVAVDIGITERAVQRIVTDLEEGGYLVRERVGRQNRYSLILNKALRHSLEAHASIGDVLRVLAVE